MLRIPAGGGDDGAAAVDVDALVAAAPAVLPVPQPVRLALPPVHSFVSPHLTPLRLSRYDSPEGVSVSTSNPSASAAEILADALTFKLTFSAGPQVEHALAVCAIAVGLALVVAGVRLFRVSPRCFKPAQPQHLQQWRDRGARERIAHLQRLCDL